MHQRHKKTAAESDGFSIPGEKRSDTPTKQTHERLTYLHELFRASTGIVNRIRR